MKSLVLLGAALAAAWSLAGSAFATTGPDSAVTISVYISDSGLTVQEYQSFDQGTELDGIPAGQPLPRGSVATIQIFNFGHKRHNFVTFGKRTAALKPGSKTTFTVLLKSRGTFLYKTTVNGQGKRFHGFFTVG